jgi:predicted nucleotide-binding protein
MSLPTNPYYHIQIKYHENKSDSDFGILTIEQEFDLSKEDIEGFSLEYRENDNVFFKGRRIKAAAIQEVEIRTTQDLSSTYYTPSVIFSSSSKTPIVTRQFIKFYEKINRSLDPERKPKTNLNPLNRDIFIVHGKDDGSKFQLANILRDLKFNPIILSELPDQGRAIIEKFENESNVGYAFVLLTPDDIGNEKLIFEKTNAYNHRARQNVIFELGYFVGHIGRNRVCCLHKGNVELPSDIHGVIYKRFEHSVDECYRGIIQELKAAKYEIIF